MSNEPPKPDVFTPPVSAFSGPIAELVGHRLLSPPTRPGLLATLARYEVIRVLGGGGMGVVLLAHDGETGADVAIKMIRPELAGNQQIVHRFVKEAGHLQKLKHPHVVPVLEISDREQGPYFVMPYFERASVAHRIKPGQPMPNEVVLDIALHVADALQFAHRRGIIHRDLKPANILLANSGSASLADFGLARTLFNDTIIDVEHEQFEGTAPYMSPGVAAGNAEDTRCDIYAFGALLYEMLTGEQPFSGRTTNEIRKQILAGPPMPLRQRNPRADPDLALVAEGAMARELRDRYADMADVLADLERIKNGRHPQGPHGLARRVRQTPPSFWIPAGLVLLGLVVWMAWPAAPHKTVPPSAPSHTSNPAPIIVPSPAPIITPAPSKSPVIAGAVGVPGMIDGPGPQARFRSPSGIAIDHAGTIYVADTGNRCIRKISPDGVVRIFAGSAANAGSKDGISIFAKFDAPISVAVDSARNVFVADLAASTVRKITPDGIVSTLAGPGALANPLAVAVDKSGNVFVVDQTHDRVCKISPAGNITTVGGRLSGPEGVAVDAFGNVFVADIATNTVWKITADGRKSVFGTGFLNPEALAVDADGDLYVADSAGTIHRVTPAGASTLLPPVHLNNAPDAPIAHPAALAVSPDGTLFIADDWNNVICRAPK